MEIKYGVMAGILVLGCAISLGLMTAVCAAVLG